MSEILASDVLNFHLFILFGLFHFGVQVENFLRSSVLFRFRHWLCSGGGISFFHSLNVLLSHHNLFDFVVDLEGGIDKPEDTLREILGIFDEETGVDEGRIVEISDKLSAVLIGFILS